MAEGDRPAGQGKPQEGGQPTAPHGDLPPQAARLQQGYEGVPGPLDYAWPADFPYGDPPSYEGEEPLFSEEERAMPVDELAASVGAKPEPPAEPEQPEGEGDAPTD